jgi:hypothetical protein
MTETGQYRNNQLCLFRPEPVFLGAKGPHIYLKQCLKQVKSCLEFCILVIVIYLLFVIWNL